MELYTSFLRLAPLVLVKLLAKGAFGPWDGQGRSPLS